MQTRNTSLAAPTSNLDVLDRLRRLRRGEYLLLDHKYARLILSIVGQTDTIFHDAGLIDPRIFRDLNKVVQDLDLL